MPGPEETTLEPLLRGFRAPLFAAFPGAPPGRPRLALDAGALGLAPVLEVPGLYPEWLGDPAFIATHGVRFPYVGGAMARGIASLELVKALAGAGMLGFFGAAGLAPERVEASVAELARDLGRTRAWGSSLIHTPADPALEERLVDLYLEHGVDRVSAAAFTGLTPAVVRFALAGLRTDAAGAVVRRRFLFAKVSRPEVARQFLSPAPAAMVAALRDRGALDAREAELAAGIPLCEDLEVEGDSGGHTDHRPLAPLFSSMLALRESLAATHGYRTPIRMGAAGGIGTPETAAAAFAMGASHVVVASVHQSALEAGTSARARAMLAQAGIADFASTPSPDMFELGARVQVLRKGTLMAVRGNQLMDLYHRFGALEELPPGVRADLEANLFRASLDQVWAETEAYFRVAQPAQLERAGHDRHQRMALVFRWYLGHSSQWAIQGVPGREQDYQLWSGPALGAFNDWVRGSFLEAPEARGVVQIALNLLEGAAYVTRQQQLRCLGLLAPGRPCPRYHPEPLVP